MRGGAGVRRYIAVTVYHIMNIYYPLESLPRFISHHDRKPHNVSAHEALNGGKPPFAAGAKGFRLYT